MCYGVPLAPIAQPLDGPWATGVREIARRHGIAILVGLFTPALPMVPASLGCTTRSSSSTGGPLLVRQIHLYDAFGYRESASVALTTMRWSPTSELADGTTARLGVATIATTSASRTVRRTGRCGRAGDCGADVVGTSPGKGRAVAHPDLGARWTPARSSSPSTKLPGWRRRDPAPSVSGTVVSWTHSVAWSGMNTGARPISGSTTWTWQMSSGRGTPRNAGESALGCHPAPMPPGIDRRRVSDDRRRQVDLGR